MQRLLLFILSVSLKVDIPLPSFFSPRHSLLFRTMRVTHPSSVKRGRKSDVGKERTSLLWVLKLVLSPLSETSIIEFFTLSQNEKSRWTTQAFHFACDVSFSLFGRHKTTTTFIWVGKTFLTSTHIKGYLMISWESEREMHVCQYLHRLRPMEVWDGVCTHTQLWVLKCNIRIV